ncbi:tRNA (guanosine(37)-N1)-methyltransferase TrmD [Hahella sp. CCB-MM4]|uniref:tRNA (guanosine(37)-N1)-methyltransferase TrmD n=1 Tax=Hahella sp. (strain CCB-MM4) TaxID=1926491 RepID=UPI000B9C396F|nr:tRNA (guanosine(37)-N1)-methyltransferase TrmD [Hahella sp. CCB-MM4]OZG70644.1 tRNA (guanosine(37)-N1)-methyltransferase TrmD [Hahella sp. CCB-MM4]
MYFGIVTLFPESMRAVTDQGVVGKAVKSGLVQVNTWNPRDYAADNYRTVDDRPYGGGPGMLMKVEPVVAAIDAARNAAPPGSKTVYLSPQGRPIRQEMLRSAASLPGLVMLCGRYEGVDERVIEREVDEEWSLGDFVLSGGEIAAMAVVDGVARLVPGVLGHHESAEQDSFENGWLDCPHYTRPEVYQGRKVPEVLLSGNHEKIRRWRLEQSIRRTLERRPDLLEGRTLSKEESEIVEQIRHEKLNMK